MLIQWIKGPLLHEYDQRKERDEESFRRLDSYQDSLARRLAKISDDSKVFPNPQHTQSDP